MAVLWWYYSIGTGSPCRTAMHALHQIPLIINGPVLHFIRPNNKSKEVSEHNYFHSKKSPLKRFCTTTRSTGSTIKADCIENREKSVFGHFELDIASDSLDT
jgi:hypothetical protein